MALGDQAGVIYSSCLFVMLSQGPLSMIRHTTWEHVLSVMDEIFPTGCRQSVSNFRFGPDTVAEAAIKCGCEARFVPLHGMEERTDEDILAELIDFNVDPDEEIIAVTDACFFRPNVSPFLISGQDVSIFPKMHRSECGRDVVDSDVVLFFVKRRAALVVHHSGFLARIVGQDGA